MKKLLFLYLIALQAIYLNAQEVTVGSTMCGSSITSNVPVKYDDGSWNSGKNNSWSLLLYKKGELNNINGSLTELGFYIDCGSSKTYTTVSNQRIYIKEITQNEITNAAIPDISTFTKVYDGDITWKRGASLPASKNVITLTNPFSYSGTKNLLIYFENESGEGFGWSGFSFLWDNQGANRTSSTLYKLSDKNSSTGYIDRVLPVTYFKFSATSSPPKITMESNKSVCSGSSFSFTAVDVTPITPIPTLKWTTSGTGFFNNDIIKNPSYTPSTLDKTNGNVTLTLTATNPDGSTNKNVTLSISNPPIVIIKKI